MRIIIAALILFASILSADGAYSSGIRQPIEEVREAVIGGLPCLEGHTAGYPGRWGAYISNYPKIAGTATYADVEAMLSDTNPVVRLIAARIALDRGLGLSLSALSKDDTKIVVGPFPGARPEFKKMSVSETLIEIRNDPLFQLRPFPEASVVIDSIREITSNGRSQLIVATVPVYPVQMASAGLSGEVTAELQFGSDNEAPVIRILKSSQKGFEESTVWALSRWKLKDVVPAEKGSPVVSRYQCHIQFKIWNE